MQEPYLAADLVREVYDKHGRDAALAVGGGLRVALARWTELDTELYGTIARDALGAMFPDTEDNRLRKRAAQEPAASSSKPEPGAWDKAGRPVTMNKEVLELIRDYAQSIVTWCDWENPNEDNIGDNALEIHRLVVNGLGEDSEGKDLEPGT
jgi:hypothetical protein